MIQANNHPASQFLAKVELPPLAQPLMRLMEICNDPEADIGDAAKTVALDGALAAKVLTLANSAFLGSRLPFNDIEQAVVFLGIDTVRNLAVSIAVHDAFGRRQAGSHFNHQEFWYHSLLCALLAKKLAEQCGYGQPAVAYLTGLLHDIGKCILATALPEEYATLLTTRPTTSTDIDLEKSLFGLNHCEAGLILLTKWQLSPSIISAVHFHHQPSERTGREGNQLNQILDLANHLAYGSPYRDFAFEQCRQALHISADHLESQVIDSKEQVTTIAQSLGISIAEPEPPRLHPSPVSGDEPTLRETVHTQVQLYGALDNLAKAGNLGRVFVVVEETIQLLLAIERSFFLLPDSEDTCLLVKGSFRNRLVRRLRDMQLPLAQNNRFTTAVHRGEPLFCRSSDLIADGCELTIADTLASETVFMQPFTIAGDRRGLAVLGLEAGHQPDPMLANTLLLLTSHLGNRLHLEELHEQHREELAAARLKSQADIARSLAHEIANPLGAIQNYLAVLATKTQDTGIEDEIQIISGEIERIRNITSQLNDLSTIPPLTGTEPTDINVLVAEIMRLYDQSSERSLAVQFACQLAPALPLVATRPDAIKQILHNLISNALDAVDNQGVIRLATQLITSGQHGRKNAKVIISVADNGPGIPEALTTSLFCAGTTGKSHGHAGLGLAIVNKLTGDIGGSITHTRNNYGETVFALSLPLS